MGGAMRERNEAKSNQKKKTNQTQIGYLRKRAHRASSHTVACYEYKNKKYCRLHYAHIYSIIYLLIFKIYLYI